MDIVERLRELSTEERRKHKSPPDLAMFDAADEIERLRQQNAELVEALHTISSVDADIVVPSRMWSDMSPLDCYEAGMMDGGMAVRDAVKTEAYAIIGNATGGKMSILKETEILIGKQVEMQNMKTKIEQFRGALKKIAAVDDEILPTPSTSEEAVLWSTLGACVDLARKALESE